MECKIFKAIIPLSVFVFLSCMPPLFYGDGEVPSREINLQINSDSETQYSVYVLEGADENVILPQSGRFHFATPDLRYGNGVCLWIIPFDTSHSKKNRLKTEYVRIKEGDKIIRTFTYKDLFDLPINKNGISQLLLK